MTDTATAQGAAREVRVHLDELLLRRRMKLTELADQVGIHQNNLSRLKNGHATGVRFETLAAICEALDCQPGDLLTFGPPPT